MRVMGIVLLALCGCAPDGEVEPVVVDGADTSSDSAMGVGSGRRMALAAGWRIQSSARVTASGEALSSPAAAVDDWVPATVPSTVMAALVAAGQLPDPGYGRNLAQIPGVILDEIAGTPYRKAQGFDGDIAEDSPFHVPWWYRVEFDLPGHADDAAVWLRILGVNYRADVFLNGRQVTDHAELAGAFRSFELDVTEAAARGGHNVLAIRVWPSRRPDLGISFVDWNPAAPDHNMGLWRPVELWSSGPVRLRHPLVDTALALPDLDAARVTATVEATNATGGEVTAQVSAALDGTTMTLEVRLAPRETRMVTFSPDRFPALALSRPRLWWPAQMGAQELYSITFAATVGGTTSDESGARFGVRTVTSELIDDLPERALYAAQGHPPKARLFRVNGRRLLVCGGGYTPDFLLRLDDRRIDDEVRQVRNLGLNTIRIEGKLGIDALYRSCDEQGILVIAGWNCCDAWQEPEAWNDEDRRTAPASLRDQMRQLHNHPSMLAWLNGSDFIPPPDLEQQYLDVIRETRWPNPTINSANSTESPHSGYSGLKMVGPYMWVPPILWESDPDWSGAWGFVAEVGTGGAIPERDSLRRFIPAEHIAAVDETWYFHAGSGASSSQLGREIEAISRRYGVPRDVDDLIARSQLSAYEAVRAMFEAWGRHKYHYATGVIQWMLNNGWPSLIWHLWDYRLKPGGGYFGAQRALEPLHVQYSPHDGAVYVVNSTYADAGRLTAEAIVRGLNGAELYRHSASVEVPADASVPAFVVPPIAAPEVTSFLQLTLSASKGPLSRNLYWLSTAPDRVDVRARTDYLTPATAWADFTALGKLLPATLSVRTRVTRDGDEQVVEATLDNGGAALAFFVRVQVTAGAGGDELLPVRWDDNYVSLWPGEARTVTARYRSSDIEGSTPWVHARGWNVAPIERPVQ